VWKNPGNQTVMLTELRIENFAIIDRLELHLRPNLITFTGETGAGKSIIIDAVETILGGRADTTFIRSGADRASLEAVFRIPDANRNAIHAILEREELQDDPNYLSLGREIRASGRNVARVNGRSVNASILRELGEYLIDVHGQSEHLSLLRVKQHLGLLDSYVIADQNTKSNSQVKEILETYHQVYNRWLLTQRELEKLRRSEQDAARRSDMLTFQINEIDMARLRPGEEEELKEERNRLANAEGLASLSQEALLALDEGEPESQAATDLFGKVVDALQNLARLDPSQAPLFEQAQAVFENMSDLSANLRNYQESIEFNPKRLDQVEERLGSIHILKRKYGGSIAEILEFGARARQQLDEITHAEERIEELILEQERLLNQISQLGTSLSQIRQAGAEHLASAMEIELADLQMSGARFMVDFQRQPDPNGALFSDGRRYTFDTNGLERVEFLIAPNPGEGFKPLVKIASGGETSRLMLALKNVLARADQIPTLIFDEIDQGIGGRVGAVVGKKLWSLAQEHQVLCITHLPQLAAFGDQHFRVQKEIDEGRTSTQVIPLDGEPRLIELAQMMGEVSEGTLRSAREILKAVEQRTTSSR
jgi:DNA repair protein RecN (Recombination protein N)